MTRSMSRTGRVILSALLLFGSICLCSALFFQAEARAETSGPVGLMEGVSDSKGNPVLYPPTDIEFSTSDQGFNFSGGIHWSHEQNAYSDQFMHDPVNHWDSAFQYTYFSLDTDVSYFSEVEMDGKTERIEGASIEPMAISSVEAVNGAPASVYRANPDAEPDRWFSLLPDKYKAYKGKGKTIKVTLYFRVLDKDGVEHTMPLGTHFFMDRQPAYYQVNSDGWGHEYMVRKGDCLSSLANLWYHDPSLWREIYECNRDTITDPDVIIAGQMIHMPERFVVN